VLADDFGRSVGAWRRSPTSSSAVIVGLLAAAMVRHERRRVPLALVIVGVF
jgi:hypothetical protein